MPAFSGLENFFPLGLVSQAEEMGYSEENILILKGDVETLKRRFPTTYDNIMSCNHQRDRRTPIGYAQDLVASWLFEDYMIIELRSEGLDITGTGADSERRILPNSKVSSASDCTVKHNGRSRPLEIMCDYTAYWSKNKKIDLRDMKYQKLKNSSSLFIGISTKTREFVLLDFAEDIPAVYTESHYSYGGKPAYTVKIARNDLEDFDIPTIVKRIENKIL